MTQPESDGPLFWATVAGIAHLGRYKRHYALGAVFIAVMLLVPHWSGADGTNASAAVPERGVPFIPDNATAAAIPPSLLAGSPSLSAALGDFGLPDAGPTTGGSVSFEPPSNGGAGDSGGEGGGDSGGSLLTVPPPPPVPIPAVPAELQPLLRAISPIVRSGCSAAGLAGVVIAVAGPGLEPVPATQLAPYLVPVYAACAVFPPFGARTVCALDDLYAVDTGGLIPSPAVIGMGIDVIDQLEKLSAGSGGPAPGTAEQLRQQLDCRRDGATPASASGPVVVQSNTSARSLVLARLLWPLLFLVGW